MRRRWRWSAVIPSGARRGPDALLNSFTLGFLVGCAVFYTLDSTGLLDLCIGCQQPSTPRLVSPANLPLYAYPPRRRIPQASSATSLSPSTFFPSLSSSLHTHSEPRSWMEPPTTPSLTAGATPAADHPEVGCPEGPLKVVILILSSPDGNLRRNAIRGTWLHDAPRKQVHVTVRFVVGSMNLSKEQMGNLTAEDTMFRDLLFLPKHHEAYSNLAVKVLAGLAWADRTLDFDYLVKADDDSYVRISKLERALRALYCPRRLYWGYFMGHAFPEASGRWKEKHWTLCPHYLPYAMGGGYVLSRRLVHLLSRYHSRLRLYSNEDVSLGSWLAPFNITYHHDLRFNTEAQSHGCNNHYIISHKEQVRGMYHKYVQLKKNGTFCDEEKEIRPSYVYNWTASSPMECCVRVRGIPIPDEASV